MNGATKCLYVSASSGHRPGSYIENKPCHTTVRSGRTQYKTQIDEPGSQTSMDPVCSCPGNAVKNQSLLRNKDCCSRSIRQLDFEEDTVGSPIHSVNASEKHDDHHSATNVQVISMSGPCPHRHGLQKRDWPVSGPFPLDYSRNARMSCTVP